MNEQILFPPKKECRVSTENVTLTMLISDKHTPTIPSSGTPHVHTHAGAELFVCVRGVVQLQTPHGIVPLRAGDVAIVPPGLAHCLLTGTDDAHWCAFDFVCTAKRQTGRVNLMQHLSPLLGTDRLALVHDAYTEAQELARIASETDDTSYLPALRFLCILCTLSQRNVQIISEESKAHVTLPPTLSEKEKDIDRLSKLDYLVNVYYMTDLSVSRAAELLFVSERQLQRITQKEYGATFAQFLCRTRLAAAKVLLADPSLTLEQVALATGFPSRAALTRALKSAEGITPSAYRENLAPFTD